MEANGFQANGLFFQSYRLEELINKLQTKLNHCNISQGKHTVVLTQQYSYLIS